jgi:hypothetical protein
MARKWGSMFSNMLGRKKEQEHPIMEFHNSHRRQERRRGGICEERMGGRKIASLAASAI